MSASTPTAATPAAPQNHVGAQKLAADAAAEKAAREREILNAQTKSVMDALTQRVSGNAASIRDFFNRADVAMAGRGFEDTVAATSAIGMGWVDFAYWAPGRGDDVSDGERAVRQLNDMTHPASSPAYRAEFARLLRLAVHATDPSIVDAARTANKAVPKHISDNEKKDPKNKDVSTQQLAWQALQTEAADAVVRGDNEGSAFVGKFIAAVGERDSLIRLAYDLGNAQSASSRWRASLFLPQYATKVQEFVEANDTLKIGDVWLKSCQAAFSAMKKHNADNGVGKVDSLKSACDAAVEAALNGMVEAKAKAIARPAADTAEIVSAAKAAVYRNLRRLVEHSAITEDTFKSLRDLMTEDAGIEDQKGIEEAKAQADKDAKKNQKIADAAAAQAEKDAKKAAADAAAAAKKAESDAAALAAGAAQQAEMVVPVPATPASTGSRLRKRSPKAAEPAPAAPAATTNGPSTAEILADIENDA